MSQSGVTEAGQKYIEHTISRLVTAIDKCPHRYERLLMEMLRNSLVLMDQMGRRKEATALCLYIDVTAIGRVGDAILALQQVITSDGREILN